MNHKYYAVVAGALIAGCSSTPKVGNVIPGEAGIYQVVTSGESADEALSSALFSAKTTCEQRQSRFIVIDQKEEYKGLVSEDTNNAINTVAGIVTAVAFIPIPTLSGDDDYHIKMQFRCDGLLPNKAQS